ncbi:hypothetical protein QE152_g29177 [Popillia japonica]|uniref:Uncharacterized protein n=1 Tax=Popillia japonica TaxID=7064 RepID=A0AAW1JJU4_POPJA
MQQLTSEKCIGKIYGPIQMGYGQTCYVKRKETLDPFYHLTGSQCTYIYAGNVRPCKRVFTLPVRYCPVGEVQVQSGLPKRRENRHSRWSVEPGKTASSPPDSTDAEPEGILIRTVGGASSANNASCNGMGKHSCCSIW